MTKWLTRDRKRDLSVRDTKSKVEVSIRIHIANNRCNRRGWWCFNINSHVCKFHRKLRIQKQVILSLTKKEIVVRLKMNTMRMNLIQKGKLVMCLDTVIKKIKWVYLNFQTIFILLNSRPYKQVPRWVNITRKNLTCFSKDCLNKLVVIYRSDRDYEETGSEQDIEEQEPEEGENIENALVSNEIKQNGTKPNKLFYFIIIISTLIVAILSPSRPLRPN